MEEDGEGLVSCIGLEESSEGFVISFELEENGESAMDSIVVKEVINVLLVVVGLCDDEGIVISIGVKEEDDEGEGVVISIGRGNEVGYALICTGIEEESEGILICESVEEGDSQIGIVVGYVEVEVGVVIINVNESNVDSMIGVEKEIKDIEICFSVKGMVESSVISVVLGKGEGVLVFEGCEGFMISVVLD